MRGSSFKGQYLFLDGPSWDISAGGEPSRVSDRTSMLHSKEL